VSHFIINICKKGIKLKVGNRYLINEKIYEISLDEVDPIVKKKVVVGIS